MLRKLIAILVLVTGLAAAGTPAQARVFDVASVRTVDAAYSCSTPAAAHGAQLVEILRKVEREATQAKQCPRPPKIVVIVPAVMLQADRARE